MRKLTNHDIKDLREYERERDEFRTEVIAMKKRRRIPVGDILTMVFENTATMRFQIQEMARIERMLRDEQIAHEIETYNELIPENGELSCTLFIELTDDEALRYWLPRLTDIERNIVFVVGGEAIEAREQDAERLTREDITSTVHYLKFSFTEAQRRAFADQPVAIVVNHANYEARVELDDTQRDELLGDFAA
jgi:predicted AAA+ superfamily ATPase